jgi:hypothetical protein
MPRTLWLKAPMLRERAVAFCDRSDSSVTGLAAGKPSPSCLVTTVALMMEIKRRL